jgi:hypothetical protein
MTGQDKFTLFLYVYGTAMWLMGMWCQAGWPMPWRKAKN